MRILVDSNLITRLAQPAHHQHQAALKAVETVLARDDDPCILPQIVYEFWAVATRPASKNGLDMPGARAKDEIERAQGTFSFLNDMPGLFDEWFRLVVQYDVHGLPAHDTRIVAAMKLQGITHILTFNVKDFRRYPEITVLDPDKVAQVPGQN